MSFIIKIKWEIFSVAHCFNVGVAKSDGNSVTSGEALKVNYVSETLE